MNTSVPVSSGLVRRYPDASQWTAVHDMEIEKLEKEPVINFSSPAQSTANPISLTLSYAYKWSKNGDVRSRKDICSLGDILGARVPIVTAKGHSVQRRNNVWRDYFSQWRLPTNGRFSTWKSLMAMCMTLPCMPKQYMPGD